MAIMVFGRWCSDQSDDPRRGFGAKHVRGSDTHTLCGRERRGLNVVSKAYAGAYNRLVIDCKQCIKRLEATTCHCMTEPDQDGIERVVTHSATCPEYLGY